MTDNDRNIERRQMRVTKVEDKLGDGAVVTVIATAAPTVAGAPGSAVSYTTTADRAPRVGIVVNVTIEAIR